MNNIAVFGPTQSGKSTLIGYLASYCYDKENFNREVKKKIRLIKSLNISEFDKDMILPSFVSVDRDELENFRNKNTIGTTKRVHRQRIPIYVGEVEKLNFVFIDTPGTRLTLYEKYKGIFEGDIGVCVLSILDVEKYIESGRTNSEYRRLFEPIEFWCAYKDPKKLIVVLSKVDYIFNGHTMKYSLQDMIDCINEELLKIDTYINKVVPIGGLKLLSDNENRYSIDEINIYEPYNFTEDICNSGTLIYRLKQVIERSDENDEIDFKWAAVDNIRRIKNTKNRAVRIKVLSGTLKENDSVILSPVIKKGYPGLLSLICDVKSLKYEKGENTEKLIEGSIGGVAFKTAIPNGSNKYRNIDMADIKLTPTTTICSKNHSYGNTIELEINEEELSIKDYVAIAELMPFVLIDIIWFGKKIETRLIHLERKNGKYIFRLFCVKYIGFDSVGVFNAPIDENGIIYDENVLMKIPLCLDKTKKYVFINTRLKDIMQNGKDNTYSITVAFYNEYSDDKDAFINSILDLGIKKDNIDFLQIEENGYDRICFCNVEYDKLLILFKNIRRFMDNNSIEMRYMSVE